MTHCIDKTELIQNMILVSDDIVKAFRGDLAYDFMEIITRDIWVGSWFLRPTGTYMLVYDDYSGHAEIEELTNTYRKYSHVEYAIVKDGKGGYNLKKVWECEQ